MPTSASSSPPVVLLGVPFHRVDLEQILDWMADHITRQEPGFIATANLDFAAQANRDAELQRLLIEADLVVCDGTPLLWASHWMHAPIPARLCPEEILRATCEKSAKMGWRVYFLGVPLAIFESAKTRLEEDFPQLQIVGADPTCASNTMEADLVSHRIQEAKPDILFVAYGKPKQEKWIWTHYLKLKVPVTFGIGDSLASYSRQSKRAPRWLKHMSCSPILRLICNPRRLATRSILDLLFFCRATARQKMALKQSDLELSATSSMDALDTDITSLAWSGRIDANTISSIPLPKPTNETPHVLLDVHQVSFMDSTGLGYLTKLYKSCIAVDGTLVLIGTPPAVKKLLAAVCLDKVIRQAENKEEAMVFIPGPTGALLPMVDGWDNEYLIWTLQGDIRSQNAEEVYAQVSLPWINRPHALKLILDISHVDFIDSNGVGTLLRLYKLVRTRDGATMALFGTSPTVRNVLQLSRLDHIFGLPPQ